MITKERFLFVFAVVSLVVMLQAWDSNVFGSSQAIILLVVTALAIPLAAALLKLKSRMLIAAGVISLLLLFIARFTSPVALQSDLFTMIPLLGILLYLGWQRQQQIPA
jgi:hypothetical protein